MIAIVSIFTYIYILLYGDNNQYKNNCHYFYENTKDTYY